MSTWWKSFPGRGKTDTENGGEGGGVRKEDWTGNESAKALVRTFTLSEIGSQLKCSG